jgi:hypothetical protein
LARVFFTLMVEASVMWSMSVDNGDVVAAEMAA